MNKKEQFKAFARIHPELVTFIKNQDMSWQKFYEIYDIYGEEESAWAPYLKKANTPNSNLNFQDKFKNIDMNSIQEHIKTAQKALSLVGELTGKNATQAATEIPKVPRPINQFFED